MPTPATESRLARIFGSPQAAPSSRNLMRGNRALAPSVNQSMVLLRFAEPIPRHAAAEFLRIHLSEGQMKGGEGKAYMAEIFQPDRVGTKFCPRCEAALEQISLQYTRCRNAQCELFNRRIANGPMRGIVDVMVVPEQIVEEGWVSGCILVLDRRYTETVLAQVYRTAGALCEFLGWRLI